MPEAKTVGRPTDCTEENIEIARAYLDNYETEHQHVVPSVAGLCKVLKLARSTLYVWAEIEGNPFKDILRDVKEYQRFELVNKGLNGDTNSVITKLMLTKHGYSDKQDVGHSGHINDYSNLEGDELSRRIAESQQAYAASKED